MDKANLEAFDRNGYLLHPGFLSNREADRLQEELLRLLGVESPARTVEEDSESVRVFYGVHETNDLVRELARHPRLLSPVKELLGGEVYVHQSKINTKSAFGGSAFAWHQDFTYWHKRDGVPSDQLVNVVLFLDDVTELNAPIFLLPGSHKEGLIETTDLVLDADAIEGLVDKYSMQSMKGDRGSVLFFHGNVVHGSSVNISPYSRRLLILTYNRVDNRPQPQGEPSPEYLASRDSRPLVASSADSALFGRAESSDATNGGAADMALTESAADSERLGIGTRSFRAWVGPSEQYDLIGALQFSFMVNLGLREHHSMLDVGCGSLRGGRFAVLYLKPGHYYGIEPTSWALEEGKQANLGEEILAIKKPTFNNSPNFELSSFGRTFDFVLAHSVFTHAASRQISRCLHQAREVMTDKSLFVATYLKSDVNYEGDSWVYPGVSEYTSEYITQLVEEAGLECAHIDWPHPFDQKWFVAHTPGSQGVEVAKIQQGFNFSYTAFLQREIEYYASARDGDPQALYQDSYEDYLKERLEVWSAGRRPDLPR